MCEPPLCGSKRTSTSKCVVLRSRHIWWIQAWVFRKSQRFSGWRQACSQQLRTPSGSFELNCSRNYVPRAENKSSSDVLMNEKHIFLMFNPLANHFLYGCLKWEPWFISGKGHKPRGVTSYGTSLIKWDWDCVRKGIQCAKSNMRIHQLWWPFKKVKNKGATESSRWGW